MCEYLIQISCDLLTECGYSYALFGNVQSDIIEKRFGRYFQMSGSNYFIGFRQLLKVKRNWRFTTASLIVLRKCLIHLWLIHFSRDRWFKSNIQWNKPTLVNNNSIFEPLNNIKTEHKMDLENNELNVVLYVFGYIIHHFLKRKFDFLMCKHIM